MQHIIEGLYEVVQGKKGFSIGPSMRSCASLLAKWSPDKPLRLPKYEGSSISNHLHVKQFLGRCDSDEPSTNPHVSHMEASHNANCPNQTSLEKRVSELGALSIKAVFPFHYWRNSKFHIARWALK